MILEALISWPIWALYTLSACAHGALILRMYPELNKDKVTYIGLSLSLGMGILGTIWSGIAIIPNGFQSWTVLLALIIPFIWGFKELLNYVRELRLKEILPENWKLWLTGGPLLLLLALAPFISWYPLGTDALAYYFAQAKVVAYNHGFVPLAAYESFGQIALPAELSYSALLLIGPELAARMITASQVWACALLIISITRSCGAGITGKWLALLCLLTSTGITYLMSDGKTDLYGAMLGLATVYLFIATPELSKRYLLLMGFVAGMAAMGKLSYLPIFIPMLGFILLWRMLQTQKLFYAVKNGFIAGLFITLGTLPNFILLALKNYIFFQQPLSPFYNTTGTGIADQVWYTPEVTAWILKTYPIVWTFGKYPMQHGILTPLVWAALPALAYVCWKKIDWKHDKALALAIAGTLGMITWAVFYPTIIAPRYIFPALLAFVPLTVRGLETMWNEFSANKLQSILFAGLLGLFAFTAAYYNIPEAKKGLRWVTRGPERSHVDYIWQGLQAGEARLPENGRMLLWGWERSPLQNKTLNCLAKDSEYNIAKITTGEKNGKEYWADIYMTGTKVAVLHTIGRKDVAEKIDINRKPSWLNIREERINDFYKVYTLTPLKGAPEPDMICAQDSHGIWKTTPNTK